MIKKVFEKVDFYKNKLRNDQDEEELDDDKWEFENNVTLFENWDVMIGKLRTVFKLVEKNITKMENFRQSRLQFLEVRVKSS